MSEFSRPGFMPIPDITRLPGEPKLVGVPHRRADSIFSEPGVADAMILTSDTIGLNSHDRRRYIQTHMAGLAAKSGGVLLDQGFATITDPEINQSPRLRTHGNFLRAMLLEQTQQTSRQPWRDSEALRDNPVVTEILAEEVEGSALLNVVNEVSDYFSLRLNKRPGHIEKAARRLIDDPLAMHTRLIDLDFVGDPETFGQAFSEQSAVYRQILVGKLGSMAGSEYLSLPDQEALFHWLKLSVGSMRYPDGTDPSQAAQQIAQKHIKGFIEQSPDTTTLIDTLYEVAKVGFTNGDITVVEHTLDILWGQTDMLSIDSNAMIDFWTAILTTTGETRQKAHELHRSRRELAGMITPRLVVAANLAFRSVAKSAAYKDKVREHQIKRRWSKALGLGKEFPTDEELGEGIRMGINPRAVLGLYRSSKRIRTEQDPTKLSDQSGPLIGAVQEFKSFRDGRKFEAQKQKATIDFPGESQYVQAPIATIRDFVQQKCAGGSGGTLSERKYWHTIAYLLPDRIDHRKLKNIDVLNEKVCRSMRDEQVHTLSPRGDRIEVTDPLLQSLGFEDFTYKMDADDKSKTHVTVRVGGYRYKAVLTPDYELTTDREHALYLPKAGAFVRHAILAYLHEIVCTENVGEVSESGEIIEQRQAFASRRAHRRVLEEGQKPSTKQVIKILTEYGIDLRQRNRARVDAGERQLITWVRQAEGIALSGSGPVVSKAPNAMQGLHSILGT